MADKIPLYSRVRHWCSAYLAEPTPLWALAVIAGGVWFFAQLARIVSSGQTVDFDQQVILALRNPHDLADPIGPRWLEEMMRDFTALGGMAVLVTVTTVTTLYLLGQNQRSLAATLLLAVIGGLIASMVLKAGFSRPRPNLVPHGSYVYSHSFPSGHAMLAASTYLTLAVMVARLHTRRRLRLLILGTAVVLTIAVGVSRVYLGVHWPTDVLAGWAGGATWALAVWYIVKRFRRQLTTPASSMPDSIP